MHLAARIELSAVRASRIALRRGVLALAHRVALRRVVTHLQIRKTAAQPWPRCGGDRIDDASLWAFAGFTDPEVVAWLEAGVPRVAAAVRLDRAGVTAREVGRQFEIGVTLGLAYARGDLDLETVRRLRRR